MRLPAKLGVAFTRPQPKNARFAGSVPRRILLQRLVAERDKHGSSGCAKPLPSQLLHDKTVWLQADLSVRRQREVLGEKRFSRAIDLHAVLRHEGRPFWS